MPNDPCLRGVQVEHPLLDRTRKHDLEVVGVQCRDVVGGLDGAEPLCELLLSDPSVCWRGLAPFIEDREVPARIRPHVRDELERVARYV